MFRIGGDVRGFVCSREMALHLSRPCTDLPHGLVFVRMTVDWMNDIDRLTQQPAGAIMPGFELLSAGVIQFAESVSAHGVVGYVERKWGLEIVDCAVAWHFGRIVSGPLGTSVTADAAASAFTDVLTALDCDLQTHQAILRAVADL
jgi:hypothetical protein